MFIAMEFLRPGVNRRNMQEQGTESAPIKKLSRKRGLEFLDFGHSTATDYQLNLFQMTWCLKIRMLSTIDFFLKKLTINS